MHSRATAALACGVLSIAGTAAVAGSGSTGIHASPHWLLDHRTGCYVYDADPTPADSVAWSGDCSGNRAEGEGTAVFSQAGRGVLTVTGTFAGGAASGEITASWADGSHFRGNAAAGRLSGSGVLVDGAGNRFQGQWSNGELSGPVNVLWSNGRHYEGSWKNGGPDPRGPAPQNTAEAQPSETSVETAEATAPTALAMIAVPRSTMPIQPAVLTGAAPRPQTGPASETPIPWLDLVAGRNLVAADGSSMTVSVSGRRVTREIAAAGVAPQQISLQFLNATQGTVSRASDSGVVGLFELGGATLKIRYQDGSTELASPAGGDGVMIATAAPGEPAACTVWYPQGHPFSLAERQAAVAAYAVRLGVGTTAPSGCAADSTLQAEAPKAEAPLAKAGRRSAHAKTAAVIDAFRAEPVAIRSSEIHSIDAAAAPLPPSEMQPPVPIVAVAEAAPKPPTQCLSVEADGRTWGFRNHCGYAVRFEYCLNEADAPQSACHTGATPGLVSANAFDPLFSDNDMRDHEHQFRWIGCPGDNADVVPRLLRTDPPAGQCVNMPVVTASKGPPP